MEALSLFDLEPEPALVGAAAPAAPVVAPRLSPRPAPRPSPWDKAVVGPRGRTVLAVDGNSLAHRAYHAYAPVPGRTPLDGFLALLAAVADRVQPDAVVVGLDCRSGSQRRRMHPAYKAGRPDKPPALDAMLDAAGPLLAELGIAVVVPPGWEADDVLGSAAATAEAAGWSCVVATSDRDAFSLVSDRTTVLRLGSGLDNAVEVTPARLRRDVGIAAGQYTEFAALRGDTSDNLAGVPGIGPTRAAALLTRFRCVDDAVADPIACRSVLGRGPGQALLDDVADPATSVFRRNVALMTIRRDVPVDLDACAVRATPERIGAVLGRHGFGALGARVAVALGARPELPPPPEAPPGW